jgi:hypothetical protein
VTDAEKLEIKSGQAYQVIGHLLDLCGMFESPEGQRALDYFSDEAKIDEDFLPWPRDDCAVQPGPDAEML